MQLISDLEASLVDEESYFRTHLVKEDIARLRKLQALAASTDGRDGFMLEGMSIGWTQNDMRTHQIKDVVEAFLAAFHAFETGAKSVDDEAQLYAAWRAFDMERMEKLIRCL